MPVPPFPLKQLQDPNGHIIARLQDVTPTKYNVGDVYRELHYIRTAGAGVVVSVLWTLLISSCLGPSAVGYPTLRGTLASRGLAYAGLGTNK